jgi:uncharacterized membrane protein
MIAKQVYDFTYVVVVSLTVLGASAILAGILTLITRASGKAVQTIANQAARLGQKGIVDDISGLVGNASALVEALNQLVRTSAGIGIFLMLSGFVMLITAYLMVRSF